VAFGQKIQRPSGFTPNPSPKERGTPSPLEKVGMRLD